MNLIYDYSPNFSLPKRPKKKIKFIIIHYTGMKNELDSIKRLQNPKFKVSSHYLIKQNGEILILVPELYEAWHAGTSNWKNYKYLNKNSIGIEITNPGHQHGYKNFSKKQIYSLKKLLLYLIKKFRIKKKYILGHSDISPDRKKDPGEKFPWELLSKYGIGVWHSINKRLLNKSRSKKIDISKKKLFLNYLKKMGYFIKKNKTNSTLYVVKAFQRRFRPQLINGKIDLECLKIAKSLTKSGFN